MNSLLKLNNDLASLVASASEINVLTTLAEKNRRLATYLVLGLSNSKAWPLGSLEVLHVQKLRGSVYYCVHVILKAGMKSTYTNRTQNENKLKRLVYPSNRFHPSPMITFKNLQIYNISCIPDMREVSYQWPDIWSINTYHELWFSTQCAFESFSI